MKYSKYLFFNYIGQNIRKPSALIFGAYEFNAVKKILGFFTAFFLVIVLGLKECNLKIQELSKYKKGIGKIVENCSIEFSYIDIKYDVVKILYATNKKIYSEMKSYCKLVQDRILEIIVTSGKACEYEIIYAVMKARRCSAEELKLVSMKKREKRSVFEEMIRLKEVRKLL